MADEREILEHALRRLLSTSKVRWFKRRRIRKHCRADLYVSGRGPKRAKYLVRHLKSHERKIRRGYLIDKEGNSNLDTAIAKAVEKIIRRVPKKYD